MRLVWATVTGAANPEAGAQRLMVRLDGAAEAARAVAYPSLSGTCVEGERVLCNTTAVDLALGTGGEHFVVARAGEGVSVDDPVPGHIMKLRYTPLQRDVTAVEEPASGHHEIMAGARSLERMPVVCCGLHSQVPMVAAAIKEVDASASVAYVMSDEASLPMAVSRMVPKMRAEGLIDGAITAGQAFGGEMEAVNIYSAMLAARHVLRADVAIIAIGPGIPGTGTPFGHSGIAQGQALNAACALDGDAIACLRLSFADERPRHVPVSHQTLTALTAVALGRATVAVPLLPAEQQVRVDEALEAGGVWARHDRFDAPGTSLPDTGSIVVRSMGRSASEDPAFFLAAASAGRCAALRAGSC